MTYIGKDFYYVMEQGSKQWRFCNQDRNIELLDLPYLSVNNAAVALQSVLLMNTRLPVNLPQAIQSILTTTLPGRCEIKKTSNGATIIIDVAHNPHAAEQLKTVLQSYSSQKIIALFSMLQDKAIEETIAVVKNFVHEWHTAVIDHPRHATKAQLQVAFDRQHIVPMWYSDVKTASDCIQSQLGQQDVWVIFGSFFLVQKVYYLL